MTNVRRSIAWVLPLVLACGSSSGDDTAATGPSGAAGTGGGASGAAGVGNAPSTGDWSCLGKVAWPAPMAATANVALMVTPLTGKVPEPVSVRVCDRLDAECAMPHGSTVTTDANGMVTVSVPTPAPYGFDGYLELHGTAVTTQLLYFAPPIAADLTQSRLLYTDATSSILSMSAGVAFDPSLAILGTQAKDCAGANAEGVVFELDPMPEGATMRYAAFDGLAVSNAWTALDGDALYAAFNVPAGTYTLTAKRAATGETIGSQKLAARAGAVTAAISGPTP